LLLLLENDLFLFGVEIDQNHIGFGVLWQNAFQQTSPKGLNMGNSPTRCQPTTLFDQKLCKFAGKQLGRESIRLERSGDIFELVVLVEHFIGDAEWYICRHGVHPKALSDEEHSQGALRTAMSAITQEIASGIAKAGIAF
jgi:hypothetical protein